MDIYQLIFELERLFPIKTALKDDRIGLQINSGNYHIDTILFAYELTDDVVDEAVNLDCDLIISFHPLIYNPLKEINSDDRVGDLSIKLIRNNISLYIIHTNFDSHIFGTNKILADKLGLVRTYSLIEAEILNRNGFGLIGFLEKELHYKEFIEKLCNIFCSPLRFCKGKDKTIRKVAILGGSGSSFLSNVIESGVDAFITADVTYHNFHRVAGKIWLCDPGHYEMEQFVTKTMIEIFTEETNYDKLKIYSSKVLTNPVFYYPNTDEYRNKQILKINSIN
jgi:dinuclear metal center YbgI/SA1388 family protein